MRVLITGAAGFLGRRLTAALIARGELAASDGTVRAISSLCLADIVEAPVPDAPFPVDTAVGDLSDTSFASALASGGFDSIFHLAALLTIDAERDPGHAYRVNTGALITLLERAERRPKLVFASSIAVFGGALPDTVDDAHVQEPTTTYGVHKAINELLIADYSRHGHIDGRALRLPIVLTRPGATLPIVSDKVAAILREPLEGRGLAVPFAAETPIPIVSVGAVVSGLIRLHDVPAARLPQKRAFNLPALTVTPADMCGALSRRGVSVSGLTFRPDPAVQAIVDGWPSHFVSAVAGPLGIGGDRDLDAVIDDYLAHRAPLVTGQT